MERDVSMLHHTLHSPRAPDALRDQIVHWSAVSERETRASLAGSNPHGMACLTAWRCYSFFKDRKT